MQVCSRLRPPAAHPYIYIYIYLSIPRQRLRSAFWVRCCTAAYLDSGFWKSRLRNARKTNEKAMKINENGTIWSRDTSTPPPHACRLTRHAPMRICVYALLTHRHMGASMRCTDTHPCKTDHITLEVLQKSEMSLPRSMRVTQKCDSHGTWE